MTTIMDASQIARSLRRIAHEIVEQSIPGDDVVLLGILSRGALLAERLGSLLSELGSAAPVGVLDTTLHRDDRQSSLQDPADRTKVPFSIRDRTVILVDDVIHTGRTIRAALDALVVLGRPRRVQVAVLVDRGHRELPIRADFVGKNVPTSQEERVSVRLSEHDDSEAVQIEAAHEVRA